MLNPFAWMFGSRKALASFSILAVLNTIAFILLCFCLFLIPAVLHGDNPILAQVLSAIFLLFFLLVHGYFWELTNSFISRKTDVLANNIYNGRVKQVFSVELPVFNPFRFVWRGLASVVATSLMILPYASMIYYSLYSGNYDLRILENHHTYQKMYMQSIQMIYILFAIFLPGALWNYAKQNSILSGLNIWKAIYLFENYPLRYLKACILFYVIYQLSFWLINNALNVINIFLNMSQDIFMLSISLILVGIFYTYGLYFSAYILGTLAPAEEY